MSVSRADIVEGPFKSTGPAVDPAKDGIGLTYHASRRTSTNWIDCFRADGSRIRVCVDTGLVGHGVEAYLSMSEEVVVLDTKTKQTLWMKAVGAWYRVLSFAQARDANTGQEIQLVRVGGDDGYGRFFEIRTGQEEYLEVLGETLVARNEPRRELRGVPIEVLRATVGSDSKITRPRCARITSRESWIQLWKEHAPEKEVLPEIDFHREMVVAVFRGETWNCKGIELVHALDCEEALEFFVRARDYQTMEEGDRVRPYGVFAIPKCAKRLIIKADSQAFIGGPPAWVEIGKFEPGLDRTLNQPGAANALRTGQREPCRFGLFMPKEDVYTETSDVTRRISQYLRGHPKDVPLAEVPFCSGEDLDSYDWKTHTLRLKRTFWFMIRRPRIAGSPFVVVADGEPIYVGAFFSDRSSFSCPVPIIRWDESMTNKVLPIERAYPAPSFAREEEDPRSDPRIKHALEALGKLGSGPLDKQP